MYVTGPPDGVRDAGLRLRRVEHRVFDGASALARHAALRPYLVDLAGRQGLAVREDVFAAGAGHSYAEMVLPLIESVTSAAEPVDLLVLAYGMHDVQPGRNIALWLASRCPGDPLAFAVTDQGTVTAFAGLRVIVDYVATSDAARVLLVVAEQAALHYPPAGPAPLPDRHAAAAMLFEFSADAAPLRVRQHAGVPVEAVRAVLAADIEEFGGADATLLAGPGVDVDAGARTVRRAPAGLPFTGLWSQLPELHDGSPVVLAEHDPVLGYLSVAAFQLRLGLDQPAVREQEEV